MNKTVRLIVTLALVAALATALLSVVNDITEPIIEAGNAERLQQALSEVIEADRFELIHDEQDTETIKYYEAYTGSELVGFAVTVNANGYGAQPINMLVGMDKDLQVTGLKILSHSETPGLGDQAFAISWTEQFIGKNIEDPIAAGDDIDIISGATSSCMGVIGGVNSALDLIAKELGLIVTVDFSQIPDGSYDGIGKGFGGDINVKITIANGEITVIEVLGHSETEGYSDPAFDNMPKKIIEAQDLEVDAVSGATMTSNGIKDAVRNALGDFLGDKEEVEQTKIDLSVVPDGRYEGQADGFLGPIKLAITIENGTIKDIEYLSMPSETPDYANVAKTEIDKQLIGSETLDVDTKTGATGTSEGIINAIKDALTAGLE